MWLFMCYVKIDCLSKKLDWRFVKYKVIVVFMLLMVILDIFGDIYKIFYVDFLE